MGDESRFDELERRVTALEQRFAAAGQSAAPQGPGGAGSAAGRAEGAGGGAPAPDEEVLWALKGLKERLPDPGAVMLVGHVQLPDERRAEWQEAAVAEDLLDAEWQECAEVLAALGHPLRLSLLRRLLAGPATVNDLVGIDGVGTSGQVYHHLRHLTAAGWLRAVGGGRYEVPAARVVPLLATILGARR